MYAHRADSAQPRVRLPVSNQSVIKIEDSPIQFVSVREKGSGSDGGTEYYYLTEFVVPDPVGTALHPTVDIRSIKVKTFPVLGKVVDVRWRVGPWDVPCLGLTNRLEGDMSIRELVMARGDHKIKAFPSSGCWVLSVRRKGDPELPPVWSSYEALARHLLAGDDRV